MINQAPVGRRCSVVKLVDHDYLEMISSEGVEGILLQRLDAREHVVPPLRPLAVDEELAERPVGENLAERALCLNKNFASVRHKQQARTLAARRNQTSVVQCRKDGLPGSCRCHHEVLMSVVYFALGLQLVQHRLLVGVRTHIQARHVDRDIARGS